MKKLLLLVFASLCMNLMAQDADTTIYSVVEEMPRFPGCEQLDTTIQAKSKCAETSLLMFFNQNIVYPPEAREKDITGQVVLSFVVEKDGFISNPVVLRDIGGGCGEEAIRVAEGMNSALRTAGIQWTPGKQGGKAVRTQVTVPIRFRLEDPPEFILVDFRDSVYTVVDDSLAFQGGPEALTAHLEKNLEYPAEYKDSCLIGSMDMTLLVRPDGYVRVIDAVDYWNLGTEFLWEAIRAGTSTWGQWESATRKGRDVPSAYDVSVTFLPEAGTCSQQVSNYEKANTLAGEGSLMFNDGNQEEGIAKLTEAINLFPQNANFLYLRGQAYMNIEKLEEACADFTAVREIVSIGLVDQLMPLICK